MMDWRVPISEGSGFMHEVANELRITLTMSGANESNFFFFESFFVSSYFSRILASPQTFAARASISGPAVVVGAGLVGSEG